MARPFTAGTIIERARTLVGMNKASGRAFITPTEALRMCSAAWTWLHAMLVKADPDYFEATNTFVSTGTANIPLPDDFYGTKRVDYRYTTNEWYRLKKITADDLDEYEIPGLSSPFAEAFRIVAVNLVLYPTPPANQTYRHIYIPAPADLTADTDIIDGRAGWETIIVMRLAVLFMQMAENDTTDMERELEREMQRVVACADDRNGGENNVIRDVECYGRRDWARRLPRAR